MTLLERNTVTLVAIAAGLIGRAVPAKGRNERDAVLNALALDPKCAAMRTELLEQSPSFQLMVRRVGALLDEE